MLHPVTWPNHGPHKELYLAEEAIGLVRSLDWEVAEVRSGKIRRKKNAKGKESKPRDLPRSCRGLSSSHPRGLPL